MVPQFPVVQIPSIIISPGWHVGRHDWASSLKVFSAGQESTQVLRSLNVSSGQVASHFVGFEVSSG